MKKNSFNTKSKLPRTKHKKTKYSFIVGNVAAFQALLYKTALCV